MLFFKAFSKKNVSPPVTTTIKSSFSFLRPEINEFTSAKPPCSTPEKIEESYNLIKNKNKQFISLKDKTHTSIIWNAGSHINGWLENYFQTK